MGTGQLLARSESAHLGERQGRVNRLGRRPLRPKQEDETSLTLPHDEQNRTLAVVLLLLASPVRAQTTEDEQAIANCAYQYAYQIGQLIMPHGLIISRDAFLKTVQSSPYYSSGASPQDLCLRVAQTVIGTMRSIDSLGH
jgi:hypothetical protein